MSLIEYTYELDKRWHLRHCYGLYEPLMVPSKLKTLSQENKNLSASADSLRNLTSFFLG